MSFLKKTDVQGVLFLALALFLTTSLASHHPLDPSLNALGQEPIQNYCGYVGAFLSDLLYQSFGWGAWLLVFISLKYSFKTFAGTNKFIKTTYFVETLFLITCCGILSLVWPDTLSFKNHIHVGGALGQMIQAGLQPLVHKAGAFIILFSSLTCCLVFQTHRPLRFYCKNALNMMASFCSYIKKMTLQVLKNISSLSKKPASIELPPIIFDQEKSPLEMEIQEDPLSFSPSSEDPVSSEHSILHTKDTVWEKPHYSLFPAIKKNPSKVSPQEIQQQTKKLLDKLAQFSITGEMVGVKSGPAVTLFEFRPADSVKVGKITQLADDLSMALSAESLRIIAPIPGRDVVGIEASNSSREMVFFRDLIKDSFFQSHQWDLPLIVGRYVDGTISIQELTQMPHLMVAGSTGSGKSVFITSILSGLLMHHSPETLRLILIDPKQVDLTVFSDIPHLLFPPVVDVSKSLDVLQWTIQEMNKRYRSLNQFHVRGIKSFNYVTSKLSEEELKNHEAQNHNESIDRDYYYKPLPHICVVIEEFGDLMTSPKRILVEQYIVRLAQMARACGIHLILAMQSPRKDVITGLIKTNIPGRISFKVSSKIDSRIILDESGAERLLAKGDMLFLTPSSAKIKRYHGPYISEEEINIIVNHWKAQGQPEYQSSQKTPKENDLSYLEPDNDEDMEKYLEIRSYISSLKTISTSSLQRRFRLGYPRAARMMEKFEEEGIVGPAQGSKPREVFQNK